MPEVGAILLSTEALAIVQAVDRARQLGYRFHDLLTPAQLFARPSAARTAASRANAAKARKARRGPRRRKVRPPLEPPMPVEERDAAIRARRDAGASLRDLGAAYQLSPNKVSKICKDGDW